MQFRPQQHKQKLGTELFVYTQTDNLCTLNRTIDQDLSSSSVSPIYQFPRDSHLTWRMQYWAND
jgi:hypothetical protein